MVPFIYIALHIFIAFTTHITGFRSKEGSHPRAEHARNQKICYSFPTLPLSSRETLNKAIDVQEVSVSQLGKWEHVLGLSVLPGGCSLTLTNWSSLH